MNTFAQEDSAASYYKSARFRFIFTRSRLIAYILAIAIFSNYIYGVSGVGYIDDFLNIVVFFWAIMAVLAKPIHVRQYAIIWFSLFIFILLSVLFLYQSPIAFVYELYKLFIFLIFVPLLASFSRVTVMHSDEKILNYLAVLMSINLLIIALQHLISPNIVTYFGFPVEQITSSQKLGRWVGLFESVNSLGDAALLLYLFNEYIRPKHYKIIRFIFFLSVIISTSKHAILVLLLIILFLGLSSSTKGFSTDRLVKVFSIFASALLIGSMAYFLNESSFNTKFEQYQYFFTNISNIDESDARFIERRALNIGVGLSIFHDNPFGVGLGVWGDASSRFNENYYPFSKVEMSDSSLIHMLVEQGVFIVFYFIVLISGAVLAKKHGNIRHFRVLLLFILSVDLVTMGLSSGGWPLLFAYIYARFLRGSPKNHNVTTKYAIYR